MRIKEIMNNNDDDDDDDDDDDNNNNNNNNNNNKYVRSRDFAEFLRTFFERTLRVAASEDEHDETKLSNQTSRLDKCYL